MIEAPVEMSNLVCSIHPSQRGMQTKLAGKMIHNASMTEWYRAFVRDMVREREDRGWSRSHVAREIGISRQRFDNWENLRNVAYFDMMEKWAAVFARRVAVAWPKASSGPLISEVRTEFEQMTAEERVIALRFARAFRNAESRGQAYLIGAIDAEELMSTQTQSVSKPA